MSSGGDHLAVGYWRRMNVAGDEPGDVRHVGDKECSNLGGDLTKPVEADDARVSARPGDDHGRLLSQRDLAHLIVVYVPTPADPVVDEVIGPAREVEPRPVREMPAMRKIHRKNLVTGLDKGGISRFVSLASRVRLHVHMLYPEDL